MTNKVFYAFNSTDMDEVLFTKDMDLDDIIDEIIDVIGEDVMMYKTFGHFVKNSLVGEIDWSNKEMMYAIAADLTEAFEEEIGVIVDYGDEEC
ncbi:MAG: hypothetical protein ACRDD8_16465 [Bacteroidales bacterium]